MVIGKFKDEANGIPLSEFIGLRPKMYSIETSDLTNIRKAKGVVGTVVKKDLTHELYKRSLQERQQMTHESRASNRCIRTEQGESLST